MDLPGDLHQVAGVVSQPLEVADGVKDLGHHLAVLAGQGLGGQLHQIGAQLVLEVVQAVLHLEDALLRALVKPVEQADGKLQDLVGLAAHILGNVEGFAHGHRGGAQQQLVQLGLGCGVRGMAVVLYQPLGKIHQAAGHRHQQGAGQQVEDGVQQGDVPGLGRLGDKAPVEQGIAQQEQRQQDQRADDLDGNVEDGHPPGLYIGADAGDERGGAGADVQAHDDGQRHAVGDGAGHGQGLQDAHGGGGALNDAGKHRADEHAQQGIGKLHQQAFKLRHIRQGADGAGHHLHAVHQHGKANQHRSHGLFPVLFGQHEHQNAREGQQGRKVFGLEHLHPEQVALDARKAGDPGGEGGAHVGAEDDVDGLGKLHDAGIHQTHQHDGGGRGGLHGDGDDRAQHHAQKGIGRHPAEHFLQTAAGHLFQAGGHDVHAVKEEGQAADEGEKIENVQSVRPPFERFDRNCKILSPVYRQYVKSTTNQC